MAGVTLPPAPWRDRPGLGTLLDALDAAAGETRVVGGAVRDTLLGLPVADLDLATRLAPQTVIDRVRAAGLKAVPTGLAHGTVTAVLPDGSVEVTTLRRDIATDGRRATVAFSDDWREDAARRDFTINALYADPGDGAVIDFFGGLDDLAAGRVRFIGDPLQRIAEDHLRILRFFRFHARFGRGDPDEAALAACAARANDLMALSRERIADELLKLLAGVDPAPVIALMLGHGVLRPVLPEITDAAPLAALVAAELRAALSIWAILTGLIELWNYRKLVHHPMATDFLISAVVHVLLGIILLAGDSLEALAIAGFTGAAALIAGVIFIIGGYSRISKARQARRAERSADDEAPEAE